MENTVTAPQSEDRVAIVSEVTKWPIEGTEGKEGRILMVEIPPGVDAPPPPPTPEDFRKFLEIGRKYETEYPPVFSW